MNIPANPEPSHDMGCFIKPILRRNMFKLPNLDSICIMPIAPTNGLTIRGRKNRGLKMFLPGKRYLAKR